MQTKEAFEREFQDKMFGMTDVDHLYVIMDKSIGGERDGVLQGFAGVISLSGTSVLNASTEMGVMIFSGFQRS